MGDRECMFLILDTEQKLVLVKYILMQMQFRFQKQTRKDGNTDGWQTDVEVEMVI